MKVYRQEVNGYFKPFNLIVEIRDKDVQRSIEAILLLGMDKLSEIAREEAIRYRPDAHLLPVVTYQGIPLKQIFEVGKELLDKVR